MQKIPHTAHIAYSGELFDVYQWVEISPSGASSLVEAVKHKDSVTVIAVTKEGKILINHEKEKDNVRTTLPGGKVEKKESPLYAAQRELEEETGYRGGVWEEWFIADPVDHRRIEWKDTYYIVKGCTKVDGWQGEEKIENALLTFDEFLDTRHEFASRSKDITPYLQKAADDIEYYHYLKSLLGILE